MMEYVLNVTAILRDPDFELALYLRYGMYVL